MVWSASYCLRHTAWDGFKIHHKMGQEDVQVIYRQLLTPTSKPAAPTSTIFDLSPPISHQWILSSTFKATLPPLWLPSSSFMPSPASPSPTFHSVPSPPQTAPNLAPSTDLAAPSTNPNHTTYHHPFPHWLESTSIVSGKKYRMDHTYLGDGPWEA